MTDEGEGPAMGWVREYNAQNMSLDELANRIAGHDFRERKGDKQMPTMARALEYQDADYEAGTFDDVYRAKAFGLLTRQDMDTIMERMGKGEESEDRQEPDFVCSSAPAPGEAPVLEIPASPEPQLIKVDDGYIRIKVTS
ncbi:MAG TPA: hypothetical protein VM754_00025 [Actinomycetota bacterium]|jgi:hypothetical protein|nr:hypothetical protein [Actinomycetota bacterium]